ncbi:unnamed protein product [Phytomonas sp. Hart1]|nr:unnamed protein product [Phytomonas sp. Hart1]|eukprot:CCW72019.1 unnamed protein product [Phytomonas sp. isolate Hart1]
MVQESTRLVWSDPHLAREVALSFNSRAGCNNIMDKIKAFNRAERQRLARALQDEHVLLYKWDGQSYCLETIFDVSCRNTQRLGSAYEDTTRLLKSTHPVS